MSKMLIIGKDGYLGAHLFHSPSVNQRFNVFGTSRISDIRCDLGDPSSFLDLENFLRAHKPEYIVMAAAIPDVEKCALDPHATRAVNVEGVKKVFEIGQRFGSIPIFFSSDYALKPILRLKLLNETDECGPPTEYGTQKLEVERWLAKNFSRHLIFRTSKLISTSSHSKNMLSQMRTCLVRDREVSVFEDQWMTPVFIEDIAQVLAHEKLGRLSGIYHLATKTVYSRYELACLIKELMGLGEGYRVLATKMSDSKTLEERPHFNTLDSTKISDALSFKFAEIISKEVHGR